MHCLRRNLIIYFTGIRKRVDDLLAFCSDKIEDYKFNIIWDTPKQAEAADSVRSGGSHSPNVSPKMVFLVLHLFNQLYPMMFVKLKRSMIYVNH